MDRQRTRVRAGSGIILVALLVGVLSVPAGAAFPGRNGAIVFARGGAIVSQSPTGAEKTLATGVVTAPSYSADGKRIVYLKGSMTWGPGWYEVFVMNAGGSGKKNLTKRVSKYSSPTFSPNGARVMFTEYDGNAMGDQRLHTVRVDGTDRRHFAKAVAGTMSDGVWSPDGTKVAYVGGPSGQAPLLRVIKSNGDKSTVRSLAPSLTGVSHPDWAPGGRRLVFERRWPTGNKMTIHRINLDRSGLRKLADFGDEMGAGSPVYSPNGARVLFDKTNYRTGANTQVWSMKASDGTGQTKVDGNGYWPSWQPRP